jgi:cytochrome c5
MKINLKYSFAIILVVVIVACSPKVNTTTKAPAPVTDRVILARITEGKSIYESNCNKCHSLHNPGKYNEKEWTNHLDRMAPKAKITDEQKETIFAYLSNNAKH